MKRRTPTGIFSLALLGAGLMGLGLSAYAHDEDEPDPAPGSTWEPETCLADNFCGHAGGYIPMAYNAVGAAMVWSEEHWEIPMIQYKGRHSEFTPRDLYDEACVEAAIISSGYSAWPIPHDEWHDQFPSSAIVPTNIFFDAQTVNRRDQTNNPGGTKSLNPCLRSSFKHLVYGGYNQRQGQTQFAADRFRVDMNTEGAVLWDWAHPDAFKTHDVVFDNVDVVEEDALANRASQVNSGGSRGLNYSIYSLGYATMEDGRVVHIGGHNMNSNSGFRKMNIFNPETNRWAPRPLPCNIANWRNDPGGVALGYKAVADAAAAAAGGPGSFGGVTSYVPGGEQLVNPPAGAPTWANCDQHNRDVVDPIHPTNPRYQRWYPSGIPLPDNRMVVYGGDDLDESVPPNEADPAFGSRDVDFRNTRIFHAVAEIYDVDTERSIPLENARKVYGLYPAATVVEFGNRPGPNDWKLCTFTGEPAPASELPPGARGVNTDDAADWRRFCTTPGCDEDTRAIRLTGERPSASTDCLDVLKAERDSQRNVPAEKHWTHIDTAKNEYGYCCGMADIMQIGPGGKTLSHRWVAINGAIGRGEPGAGTRTADIEMMDWKHPQPRWSVVAQTYQPGSTIHAVPLPDGTVVLRGGSGPGGGTYELRNYTKYQLFNPNDFSVRVMTKTTHLGGLHKTVMLMPDASVIAMAGDRTAMVALGDRRYTPGDQDLGVSVAQIFEPPYLFADAEGTKKSRPTIQFAPDRITYGKQLSIQVGDSSRIKTVSLVRTGAVTHQLANDNRVVILNWKRGRGFNEIIIDTPDRPAQSLPGDQMLFVVDQDGTPSKAKHVRLLRKLRRGEEFVNTTRTPFPFPHVHERWQ